VTRRSGDAGARYGANLLPLEYRRRGRARRCSPYPYERTREALERLAGSGDAASRSRLQAALRSIPVPAGHPFPTMAVCMQWFPAGFPAGAIAARTAPYSASSRAPAASASGRRASRSPRTTYSWCRRGQFHELQADHRAVLFSYSDRAAQEALGSGAKTTPGRRARCRTRPSLNRPAKRRRRDRGRRAFARYRRRHLLRAAAPRRRPHGREDRDADRRRHGPDVRPS
jgi:gentisate 1,2-dioxygenase